MKRVMVSFKMQGYPRGWRGVWEHAKDVFWWRPCRTANDYTVSLWADGQVSVTAEAQTLGAESAAPSDDTRETK